MKLEEAKRLAKKIAEDLGINWVDQVNGTTAACPNSMIIAGSTRRGKAEVGDIDVVVTAPLEVSDIEYLIKPKLIWSKGTKQIFFTLEDDVKVNIWLLDDDDSFGAMMLHTTGSQQHNIILRKLAKKHGFKLNQYGLYEGVQRIAGRTEQEIYNHLPTLKWPDGKPWVNPEDR